MSEDIDFAKDLIKGKIAEHIFELMFRSVGKYDVIPFGYEYSQPQLAQHIHLLKEKKLLDTLTNSPDFLLITSDKTQAYFVEVKFRSTFDLLEIKNLASELVQKWDPAFLFVATPQGFYYSSCHNIINNGDIDKLEERFVSLDIQDKYLQLLKEFEK